MKHKMGPISNDICFGTISEKSSNTRAKMNETKTETFLT